MLLGRLAFYADSNGDLQNIVRQLNVNLVTEATLAAFSLDRLQPSFTSRPSFALADRPQTPDGSSAHFTARTVFDKPDHNCGKPKRNVQGPKPVEWRPFLSVDEVIVCPDFPHSKLYGAVEWLPWSSVDTRSIRLPHTSLPFVPSDLTTKLVGK